MNITKDIVYVGVNDHQVDLFEGQIRDYKDFKAFSDSVGVNTDESFISRNFYQEFTGRFDRKLYDNIL